MSLLCKLGLHRYKTVPMLQLIAGKLIEVDRCKCGKLREEKK